MVFGQEIRLGWQIQRGSELPARGDGQRGGAS